MGQTTAFWASLNGYEGEAVRRENALDPSSSQLKLSHAATRGGFEFTLTLASAPCLPAERCPFRVAIVQRDGLLCGA